MRRLLILILILLFGISTVYAQKRVVVGAYQNKPLIFKDEKGDVSGIFVDILNYVAEQEDWDILWVYDQWTNCLQSLEAGETDLQAVIAFSEKRDEIYDFNKIATVENWGIIYQPKGTNIKKIDDVNGKRIALLPNDIHVKIFKQSAAENGVNFTPVEANDYSEVFQLIVDKKADAGIVNRFFGIKNEAQYNVVKSLVFFNPIKVQYAAKDGLNTDLLNSIDKHLKVLKADKSSEYYRSLDRWLLKKDLSWWEMPGMSQWAAAGILILFSVFFVWYTLIRRGRK